MPIVIDIAIVSACSAIAILAALSVMAGFYLKARMESLEIGVSKLRDEASELIRESRAAVAEIHRAAARVSKPMDELEHIMLSAREWTDRADRVIDAVGVVAEPPLLFLSKKMGTLGVIVRGVLQVLLTPKTNNQPAKDHNHVRR